jgi:CHASE1-domain containing sensor protein
LGWVVWQGQLPGLLAGLLPGLAQGTPLLAALLLFLAGFVAVLSITVAVVMWRQPRARRSASALSV